MAQREVDVEHRWGMRRALDVGVKLYVRASQPRFGRLLNASSSGAYVATGVSLPVMTHVQILLGWDGLRRAGRHRLAAYVVRADRRGIGIEWQEFAPAALLALFDALDVRPSRQGRRAPGGFGPAYEVAPRLPLTTGGL